MILCAGEALIDMLPRETASGEQAFAPHAGGAVFNTAIALGRLGRSTGFFSGISSDLFGTVLTDTLDASGVDSSLAARPDRPTTLAFVTLKDGHASYAFYDENTAGRMITTADLPTLDDSTQAVFFGGISLVVEPCANAYEALAAREAGARVIMLDPNVRQGFIRDEAAYRARMDRMVALADIVKVSDEDLAWLAGHDDLDRAASEMLSRGPHLLCLTLGGDGVRGVTARGSVQVSAETVEVVDTVGAGDTFTAGVRASLYEAGLLTKSAVGGRTDPAITDALTLGARAAAVTVSRAGANPPMRVELG
ncbi:MAG: carbohydrate kinase [Pseudomonadota bacterium]